MTTETNERIEKLLALLLLDQMGSSTQEEKAAKLSIAGFSNIEIADILETTTGTVATRLSSRKAKRKTKSK